MPSAVLKLLVNKWLASVETAVSRIDHNSVIKDLAGRADLSGSYLLMIFFSCLVALLGLLVNSVAVVIGAMLISPLIGPIYTAALSFSLGDLRLARRALNIIVVSIILSVLVTAFFTLLSPLKVPTAEILSRTRPNVYDLLIAAFAGAAGAYALCTRVNYLFVTTGVAVATAVIPPLSVVGYGLGSGHIAIALGGFLLFFTNLVAIVISSDIVFHVFKFRATMVEEARYPVRRRVQILGSVLALISIPLVYTLVTDIRKAKLTSRVEQVLRKNLDSKDHSRITDFSLQRGDDGVTVTATVNTVSYYDADTEKQIEKQLKEIVHRPVQLDLEQVIVKSGNVAPQIQAPRLPLAASSPQPENMASLQEKIVGRLKSGCEELQPFLAPYNIRQCGIRLYGQGEPATILMSIGRDYPYSGEEQRWLKVVLEQKLGGPLDLELTTVPFLPPLTLGKDGSPDETSRKALAVLSQFPGHGRDLRVKIDTPSLSRRNKAHNGREFTAIRDYLVNQLGLSAAIITRAASEGKELRVTVEPASQQGRKRP